MSKFNKFIDGLYISKLREGEKVELQMIDGSVIKAYVFIWDERDSATGKVLDKKTVFTSEDTESQYVIQIGRGLTGRVLHRYITGWRKLFTGTLNKRKKFKDRFGTVSNPLNHYD